MDRYVLHLNKQNVDHELSNEAPKTVQDVLRGTAGLRIGFDGSAKGGGSMQVRGQRSVYSDGGHNDPQQKKHLLAHQSD